MNCREMSKNYTFRELECQMTKENVIRQNGITNRASGYATTNIGRDCALGDSVRVRNKDFDTFIRAC